MKEKKAIIYFHKDTIYQRVRSLNVDVAESPNCSGFWKDVCDLENNCYLISHSQKLPLKDCVRHWFWPELLIYLFLCILNECQQRAKAVCLSSMHSMECACTPWQWTGSWTTIPVDPAKWFGLGFLSKRF